MLFQNKKKVTKKKNQKRKINKKDYIECPICSAKLYNPDSILAGIGPVCNKKQRFAESLDRQDLKSLANKRKSLSDLKINTTVILKDSSDYFFLGTILFKDETEVVYLDLTDFNSNFRSTKVISDSFLNSIKSEFIKNLEYYSIVDKPSSPDIKRKYNKFIRDYKKILDERDTIEKEILERGLSKRYVPVKTRGTMTERQKFNRKLLMELKTLEPEEYDLLWNKGHVQINTFLSRINKNETIESQKIYEYLYKKQNKINLEKNLKIKDYGLTEDEILNGLKHSGRTQEYLAAKAFIEGSRNLLLVLATLKKIETIKDLKTKGILLKEINNMIKKNNYSKEDLKKALS